METQLSGFRGRIRAGYRTAVELANWNCESSGGNVYRIDAEIAEIIPLYASYSPLRIELILNGTQSAWTWTLPVGGIEDREDFSTVVVGEPEIRRVSL